VARAAALAPGRNFHRIACTSDFVGSAEGANSGDSSMPAVCTKLLKYRRVAIVILLAACAFLVTAGALMFNMDVRPRKVLDPVTYDGRHFSELATGNDPDAHDYFVNLQVSFSSDGRWFATHHTEPAGEVERGLVQVWETATGKVQAQLIFYGWYGGARDIDFPYFQFSPDERYVAVGYYKRDGRQVGLLDVLSGQQRSFDAFRWSFSSDGSRLAIVEESDSPGRQQLRIIETASGREMALVARSVRTDLEGANDFWDLAFLADRRTLTYTTYNPPKSAKTHLRRKSSRRLGFRVVLWDVQACRPRQTIAVANYGSSAVAPNGKFVASLAGNVGRPLCKLLDAETGRLIANLKADHGQFGDLKFAPDSSTLTATSLMLAGHSVDSMPLSAIAQWDVRSRTLFALYDAKKAGPGGDAVYCYYDPRNSFLPRYALRQYVGGRATIVNAVTGKECFALPADDANNTDEMVSNGWNLLSPDQNLFVLHQHRFRKPQWLRNWFAKVIPGMNPPNCTQEDLIRSWDMATGHEYTPLPDGWWGKAAFAPDNRTLATLGDDGRIRFWDLPPRKPLGLILAWSCVPAVLVLLLSWWRWRRQWRLMQLAEAKPA
jgi:WD40 repeat protein